MLDCWLKSVCTQQSHAVCGLQEMVIWSSVRQEIYLHVYVHNIGLYHMSGFCILSVGNVSVLGNGSMKRCETLSFLLHHRLSIIMRIWYTGADVPFLLRHLSGLSTLNNCDGLFSILWPYPVGLLICYRYKSVVVNGSRAFRVLWLRVAISPKSQSSWNTVGGVWLSFFVTFLACFRRY